MTSRRSVRVWMLGAALVAVGSFASSCASSEMDLAGSPGDSAATSLPAAPRLGVLSADFDSNELAPPGPATEGGHPHHGSHGATAPTTEPRTPPDKPAEGGSGPTYTCSHHPEVTSSSPGTCPKCGMDLVEKQGAAAPSSAAPKPSSPAPAAPAKSAPAKPAPAKPAPNPHEGMEGM